jgi:2-oxo-4-hydroxy-4-carboxy-5-ureidoimidazoline decarboxylase
VNSILAGWNNADDVAARDAMLACCGAKRWAAEMAALRPIESVAALNEKADEVWSTMEEADWLEAFACHPRIGARIGERKAEQAAGQNRQTFGRSAAWSKQERARASTASEQVMADLAEGNREYEDRFGFTYIVCATGKSAEEMLAILKRRLGATREAELREAAEQQWQIMQIRLKKWLAE